MGGGGVSGVGTQSQPLPQGLELVVQGALLALSLDTLFVQRLLVS